ncbi:MAG: sulfatase-like hydrolase/transferase [Anaerolineae bacterium]
MPVQPERPNILLVFTDQNKLSAIGSYGDTPCQTPNLDRLAQTSTRFETAYTTCPVCSPARGTIMTGLYPHAHGICSNVHNLGSSVHELADRPELLSRRLQSAGYRCGYSGKWHLGTDQETIFGGANHPTLPRDVGFEGQQFPGHGGGGFRYPEYQAYLREHGYEHKVTQVDDRDVRVASYSVLEGPTASTVPYFLAEHTIELIDGFAASGDPFFIWHNFWGPHGPYFAPREFYELYRDVEMPEWPNYRWPARAINRPHQVKIHPQAESLTWDDWAEGIRHYYAFMTLIDQQIGRILAHLDATGLRDNTIIIFTADHGETLGTHGGLTDKGWHHFEEIQRIPMVIWLPEHLRQEGVGAGRVVSQWASLADVYPTILDYAGADLDADRHGRSLRPLLEDQPVDWRERIFVEFNGVNSLATSMVSVREGDLKYGWNCSNHDELYDLARDPYEINNLIDDPAYTGAVRHLREVLDDWMVATDYPIPAVNMYRNSRRL